MHYNLGKLVLTEVHVPQVDQALQATRYVVQGALRVPAHRYKFKTKLLGKKLNLNYNSRCCGAVLRIRIR